MAAAAYTDRRDSRINGCDPVRCPQMPAAAARRLEGHDRPVGQAHARIRQHPLADLLEADLELGFLAGEGRLLKIVGKGEKELPLLAGGGADEGIRVPLIVRFPDGTDAGTVNLTNQGYTQVLDYLLTGDSIYFVADDGTQYLPLNLADAFKEDGLKVRIEALIRRRSDHTGSSVAGRRRQRQF